MEQKIRISTVTPVYAGEDYLEQLIEKLEELKVRWNEEDVPLELIESIFVNDASRDGSLDILYKMQKEKNWIKLVNLSRNYGQHPATVAGVLHSSGDWVVTLDEDLQHDPSHIEQMLKTAILNEQDVVYAKPEEAVHKKLIRDFSSKAFKAIVAKISNNHHIRKFNSYRLIRGTIARASASVCSHGTYYDMALCWFTDRLTAIQLPLIDKRYIETGKSGYTLKSLISHARRMLINSETKIIRTGAAIGFVALILVISIGGKVLYDKLFSPEMISVPGWTSLLLSILFFGGLISVLLGVLLEFMSVILLHIQGKPAFFVVDRRIDEILMKYFLNMKK
jgi:glycosyltransferase involved in cell wall biosynthesis